MKKILVVDDSELIGKLVKLYLGKLGCDVEICTSPFGVLQKVKEFMPHVILLDMKMPGLSGRSVARLLKKSERGVCCKTILFSSESEILLRQMVEEGLADSYFVKNNGFDGLRERIESVLATA